MSINSTHDGSGAGDTGPQGTRVFRREDIDRNVTGAGGESGVTMASETGVALIGAGGASDGMRIDVPAGRSTLGRDATNNIVVDDDSVSLVHARLFEKDGEWRVLNLLSTNGTWINDRKVSDGVLRDGDTVCFGEARFTVRIAAGTDRRSALTRLWQWLTGAR